MEIPSFSSPLWRGLLAVTLFIITISAGAQGQPQEKLDQKCPSPGCSDQSPLPVPRAERSIILGGPILFDTDKTTINPGVAKILDRLVTYLKENPDKEIDLEGHTDSSGSDQYNQSLSERRAASVKDYLIKRGIDPRRIYTRGFGETKAIADENTSQGRAKNRRTEVKLRSVEPAHTDNYAVRRVFFATDRNLTGSNKPDQMFGFGRSDLRYGTCEVSIPRDHRMGHLESPSIWRLEFREDPDKHVVLLSVVVQSKDKYFADIAANVHASIGASAFLFVHGYNVTFEDAARRTAQISYDLGFDGIPVFYSWPSQGKTPAYTVDEQNIEWAQANLKGFLEDFFGRSDVQRVYLIAHSMGTRAVTRAVASLLAEKPSLRQRLKEVILAAPDIDADVFKRDIASALTKSGQSVTLYASSEDLALAASKRVHGSPRAGDSGQGLVVVPGIETIDATGIDTSLVGHSYFAEARSILSDFFYLVRNGQRADQRFGLYAVDTQEGRYWGFRK